MSKRSDQQKHKNNINYYEVLGVEPTATQKEIKKQYTKLVAKYHPDKVKDGDVNNNLFELIQKAYEYLGDPKSREEYDFYTKNIQGAKHIDHMKLKADFSNYVDLAPDPTSSTFKKEKQMAELEFDRLSNELDVKNKVNRELLGQKLTKKTMEKSLDEIIEQRMTDELNFNQVNMFPDGNFDNAKFNAIFDKYKENTENEVVKHNGGVMPYNFGIGSDFSSYNDAYGKTFYGDNEDTGDFGSTNFGSKNTLDQDTVKNIKPAEYTFNHNKIDPNYNKSLDELMKQREEETTKLNSRKYTDYQNGNSEYMFMNDIGCTDNMIDWDNDDDDDDLVSACNKLIELEKTNE